MVISTQEVYFSSFDSTIKSTTPPRHYTRRILYQFSIQTSTARLNKLSQALPRTLRLQDILPTQLQQLRQSSWPTTISHSVPSDPTRRPQPALLPHRPLNGGCVHSSTCHPTKADTNQTQASHGLFEGLTAQKRKDDPASIARRQSMHEQRPRSGFIGQMWNKLRCPSPFLPPSEILVDVLCFNSWVYGTTSSK